jgi:hydroxymethylglutaryl-CoA lyase
MTKPGGSDRPVGAIRITEVGPRDGLQNEPTVIPTVQKIAFIEALSNTGVTEIEAGAFVSSKAVPQLADSDEVFRKLSRKHGVTYSALIPNERGLERALEVGIEKVAVFTAATDAFTKRNIHATIAESLQRFQPVVKRSHDAGLPVRGYISTVAFCPYEGRVRPAQVVDVMRPLLDLGVEEVALGETLGRAAPRDIRALLEAVLLHIAPHRLVLHLHDTYGMAVANALVAWEEYAITAFDASAGGLGGCPYAPGASGNVATEDLVSALKASGAEVPVNETMVVAAAQDLARALDRALTSRLARVLAQDAEPASRTSS